MSDLLSPDIREPSSPEEDGNLKQSLEIDMKALVGDAVGNMSISPSSRDVVLATRNGLFIIDLEAPLNVPRFLPQGGTWDVADVQWNPHPSRKEYIVSTSNEKLLIWNLFLTGRTSIEHVLRSHYRAITDINWHTTEPDTVVSTGIDSWLWAWDLRASQKPVMGLCAFGCGGTQVKWNRQDGHLLASSHQDEVLLWDRRKGSLPISRIQAHNAKIYGIDWAHDRRDEIVTCSLDKSIKVWDTQTLGPKLTISTMYPVWRARDLPFGRGLLSLPQRGETALEMYSHDTPDNPVEVFEGHEDVVKEFVWRRGGHDCSGFQLITWSKDKTLRFWPVDTEVMQKAGKAPPTRAASEPHRRELKVSFSNPPVGTDLPPALSAPIGYRGILAEVRAPFPPRPAARLSTGRQDRNITRPQSQDLDKDKSVAQSKPIPITQEKGRTMTRGLLGGRSAQINTSAWLSSVKFGTKRDGSSGPGSGAESGEVSRFSSLSRPPSQPDSSGSRIVINVQKDSPVGAKGEDGNREGEVGQSLQEEITFVTNKLATYKVKLERAEWSKKPTCTFGLHGPWGDSTSVFIRISFTFPRDYPQAKHPYGTPSVDLEKNSLISMKSRAFILRRLRAIRENDRPCLEKCLRFLLFGDDEERINRHPGMDSESSSDEDIPSIARTRKDAKPLTVRRDKNLAEPRTSQGVFGPHGELVCFFRAPPRIVRNIMREISVSPSVATRRTDAASRQLRSPFVLSDAVHRLAHAAQDRDAESVETRQAEDAHNVLRIVADLFTFSQQKPRRLSEHSRQFEDKGKYSLLPTRSTVYIKNTSGLVGIDVGAARDYSLAVNIPSNFCRINAQIAKKRGRADHERVFRLLEAVFSGVVGQGPQELLSRSTMRNVPAITIIHNLYSDLSAQKDIQMLAMLSVLLLHVYTPVNNIKTQGRTGTPNYRRSLERRNLSLSPIWSRDSPSPTFQPSAPPLSSPSSSKGSWSSLFNTGSMRQLVSSSRSRAAIPVPEGTRIGRVRSQLSQTNSREPSMQPTPPVAKSWSEAAVVAPVGSAVTFLSAGHTRRPTFSQVVVARSSAAEKRRVAVSLPLEDDSPAMTTLHSLIHTQLLCHILAYTDVLLSWKLPEKRADLLKSVEATIHSASFDATIINSKLYRDRLGYVHVCPHGTAQASSEIGDCPKCIGRMNSPQCSVCRLPVNGLSYACLACMHSAHVACRDARQDDLCPSGCGCHCIRIANFSRRRA